jgi:uncharacterized membrane protein YgcG
MPSTTMVKSTAFLGMPRTAPIMDLSGVIPPDSARRMLLEMEQAQMATGSEIQILVVDQLNIGMPAKKMATSLFNEWRVGTSEKNNGVLILAVLDDRRIEIEVGRGLNKYMGGPWCSNLLQQTAVPNFRNENYGQGLEQTVAEIAQRLKEVDSEVAVATSSSPSLDPSSILIFSLGLVYAVVKVEANMYPKRDPCPECDASYRTWEYNLVDWKTVLKATDMMPGGMERPYVCKNCGYETVATQVIRQYDGSETDSNGMTTYYYDSDSNSDSGGSSDGDGGGGSDW